MSRLRDQIRTLGILASFAPNGVKAQLDEAMPQVDGLARTLLVGVRLRETSRSEGRLHPYACSFPALCQPGPLAPLGGAPILGGLVHVLACSRDIAPHGSGLLQNSVTNPSATIQTYVAKLRDRQQDLHIAPLPLLAPLAVTGSSCEGAVAVAYEAMQRGVAVPSDVIVSSAVVHDHTESTLAGVTGCRSKAQVVALERPGARFFVVPCKEEARDTYDDIKDVTVVPIRAGTKLKELFSKILPEPDRGNDVLDDLQAKAEREYFRQNYSASKASYERLLLELNEPSLADDLREQWRLEALLRLGGIALHAGRLDEAEQRFKEVEAAVGPESRHLGFLFRGELELSLAGAHIDRFSPALALDRFSQLLQDYESRWASEPSRINVLMVVGALGGLRRVHLLRGDPEAALEVQGRILRLAPQDERSRTLVDLTECLRRAGDLPAAAKAAQAAYSELARVRSSTSRDQTEAFLTYYSGLMDLDAGQPLGTNVEPLYRRLSGDSAAACRLALLRAGFDLRSGRPGALQAFEGLLVTAASGGHPPKPVGALRRWLVVLMLLRCARLVADPVPVRQTAARVLDGLQGHFQDHPLLEKARREFIEAVGAGRSDPSAERDLLRLTAY